MSHLGLFSGRPFRRCGVCQVFRERGETAGFQPPAKAITEECSFGIGDSDSTGSVDEVAEVVEFSIGE